jgi:hypothetical protein
MKIHSDTTLAWALNHFQKRCDHTMTSKIQKAMMNKKKECFISLNQSTEDLMEENIMEALNG